MWLFGPQITELCLEFICYDPNYNYGSDDEDEFMETDMEDDDEEWVMRNRGFHDVWKICWWESGILLLHDRHSLINNYWMRFLWYPEYSRSRGAQRLFPPKRIEKSFYAIQSTIRSLEMYSKQRYENLHLFGHPRGTWGFSKLQGLQCYFSENFRCSWTFYESEKKNLHLFGHPWGTWGFSKLQGLQCYFSENFRCSWTFYESENFSCSSFHLIFESENFRFFFFYEN